MFTRLFLFAAVTIAPIAVSSDCMAQQPTPAPNPQQLPPETAYTRIFTPENEQWFFELIELNPRATVVVVGQGIAVSEDAGLVLPPGPKPADVTLVY